MRIVRLLLATVTAFGLACLVVAPTAAAAPAATSCSTSGSTYSTGVVRCTGTTRQYRAKVGCTDQLRGSFAGYYYGLYVNPGQTSSKKCPYQGNVQFQATSVAADFR